MSTPRRRIVRPRTNGQTTDPQRHRQTQRLRERLAHERTALARWQKKLRRAFTKVEKLLAIVDRLEKKIARLDNL
jgi:hypothetical protein